ncbi:hypothetical protein D3C80_1234230 [compost metagenome]
MQIAALKGAGEFGHLATLAFTRHAQAEHRVNFVILNMQDGTCARELAQQAHAWRAKQRGHHADNTVWLPATLRHQRKEAAERKAAQMNQTLQRRRLFWHVQRTAPDGGIAHFTAIAPAGVTFADFPLRIVRRGRNDPHLVALARHPLDHFTSVFTDAGQFG